VRVHAGSMSETHRRRKKPHPARRTRRAVGAASAAGLVGISVGMAIDASAASSVVSSVAMAAPAAVTGTATVSTDQNAIVAATSAPQPAPRTVAQPVTVTRGS